MTGIQFCKMDEQYLGEFNGVKLKSTPAMEAVLKELTSTPIKEREAWARFLTAVAARLMVDYIQECGIEARQ